MTTKPSYTPSTAAWPTNVRDECAELHRKVSHLHRLASAFAVTGNDRMADDLYGIAQTVETAVMAILEHNAHRLDSDLRTSQALSGAIVQSALAGVRMASVRGN